MDSLCIRLQDRMGSAVQPLGRREGDICDSLIRGCCSELVDGFVVMDGWLLDGKVGVILGVH